MITYDETNWKYEIPFNNDIYRSVKHFSFLHSTDERKIFDAQIHFHRHNFSFQQLIDAFKLCEESDIPHFKEIVYKRKKDILYCPAFLQKYYYNIIQTEFSAHSEFLGEMLNTALTKHCITNPCASLYKQIFGVYYKSVKNKIKKYSKRKLAFAISSKIKPNEYVNTADKIINTLENDPSIHGIFGEFNKGDLWINKHIGFGNAEFKSAQFYTGEQDIFTIATNNNTLTLEQLKQDIYFNVYPGMGHFCNSVVPKSEKFLNLGANIFINGWNTFVSWHAKVNTFTKNDKIERSKICSYLLKSNYKKALKQLYVYLLGQYSQDNALKIIIKITQFPMLYESCVMGAIATELLIKKGFAGSPMDLLNKYKKVNCGDFFALYKKQK